ncbi:MAG TPA: Gfo/Idh/MocA family oxidoreductase [Woeseiaceae bacterium]|nr:Gfo/Idh/MocA family oxidoreductase [Woeseiaceae bacterium]
MADKQQSRRDFLASSAALSAGAALAFGSAASYARIVGANERLNLAFVGVRSRGKALFEATHRTAGETARVHTLCDVDSRVLASESEAVRLLTGEAPVLRRDFRTVVEDPDIDAVVIATPDHTHAPFAILAAAAGLDVYVEKPCSHNPHEGELLVDAARRHKRVVQMGNQQRSAPTSIEAIADIRGGAIGRPYMGKAWYSNARPSIGRGAAAPVPDWLDWDLWQGPAPRREYRDNIVHYNWHWFWHWGTGEVNNNGLHEIDICRWALDVGLPKRVTSGGGRYHFDDDWEFYDTQVVNYEYDDALITWEGRSSNPYPVYERGRGATIHGTDGTILIDRNGYQLLDNAGALVKQVNERAASGTTDLTGGGALDDYHLANFFAAIRDSTALHAPIDEGAASTLMCHLGNIAQKVGRVLEIEPDTGRIRDDREAMQLWKREYAPGWEPRA